MPHQALHRKTRDSRKCAGRRPMLLTWRSDGVAEERLWRVHHSHPRLTPCVFRSLHNSTAIASSLVHPEILTGRCLPAFQSVALAEQSDSGQVVSLRPRTIHKNDIVIGGISHSGFRHRVAHAPPVPSVVLMMVFTASRQCLEIHSACSFGLNS
jgi:hypothetical protein